MIHADLARDVERLDSDAVENLSTAVEPNIRKWFHFRRPKDTRQHSPEHQISKAKTRTRTTAGSAKRQMQREFGDLLRQTRDRLQLSAEEFAQRVGWDHPFVNSVEAGRCQPSIERLHKLAQTLALPKEEIHILENKLKEIAQFILSKTLLKQAQPEAAPNFVDQTPTKAIEGNSVTNRAQGISKFLAWEREIPTHANLNPLTSAILESAGELIGRENLNDRDSVEQHPHVLDDCLSAELKRQESQARVVDITVEQDAKNELFFIALGRYLKTRRCDLKLKRRELAAQAKVESRIVARAEDGKEISARDMIDIAVALELKPGEIADEAQKLIPD